MLKEDNGRGDPFAAASVFETKGRAEGIAAAESAIAPMKVQFASSQGAFSFRLKTAKLVDSELLTNVHCIENGATFDVQYEDTHLTLEIPVEGNTQVSLGGRRLDLAAKRSAVLFGSGQKARIRDLGNPYRAHSYKLNRRLVARRLQQLTGSDKSCETLFDPVLDLTSTKGQQFLTLASIPFASDLSASSVLNSPASAALFEELLVNLLLTNFPHSLSGELDREAPLTSESAVRTCEEYLQAHAQEVITIGGMAQSIGVSVRSLQRTFQNHTGTTPMRRLKEIRLERARLRLLNDSTGAGVTQIALGVGFTHLSAFAADYKARFGESPSVTLRRHS